MERSTRKCTRSAKGLEHDEILNKADKNNSEKKRRSVEKPKASRKIVFNDEPKVKAVKNLNQNHNKIIGKNTDYKTHWKLIDDRVARQLVNKQTGQQAKQIGKNFKESTSVVARSKIIDPCFKNVLAKELKMDKQNARRNDNNQLFEFQTNDSLECTQDGIVLDVEAEELDYVDDLDDDLEVEPTQEINNTDNTAANQDGKQEVTHEMTDEQILGLPRVKNLFNQFWEEKMKEINNSGNGKQSGEVNVRGTNGSPVIKSPSDTTIYDQREFEAAQARATSTVVEAENFKASIAQPNTGMVNVNEFNIDAAQLQLNNGQKEQITNGLNILNIGAGVSDDDFFHLTCHIEPSLIHKIEKGEFVELEKLLPKEKLGGGANKSDENRLEWVQRDGGTYLVPAQRDNKITSFRRWEQAFRAYATIYCGANPHRSKEIWQYISVINTAASSYVWDNVYNYDITFRHLMAFNPNRSWAVTYN